MSTELSRAEAFEYDFEDEPPTDLETTGIVPPHDLDAEAAVLSAVILDPIRLTDVSLLLAEHFYSGAHQRIYGAILELHEASAKIDVVTVAAKLKAQHRLGEVGGMEYLGQILDGSPSLKNIAAHAEIVYERWRLRKSILDLQKAVANAFGPVASIQTHLDNVARDAAALAKQSPFSKLEPQARVLGRIVERMAKVAKLQHSGRRVPGIPTGIRSLDMASLGMQAGHKIVVMAQRGRGKSSFAIQACMHAAGFRHRREPLADDRVAVRMYVTEESRENVALKMLSHAARVDSIRLTMQQSEPTLTFEEWDRVNEAFASIASIKMTVNDDDGLTFEDIVADVRQQSGVSDGVPLGLFAIDYIQRLRAPARLAKRREDEQIGDAAQAFKELAKELNIACLECAQMNPPDLKISKTGKPYENLASQCKRIEKEANQVWCLWRKTPADLNTYGLACTKQRGGSEFDLDLEFEPEYSTFVDPAYKGFRSAFDGF